MVSELRAGQPPDPSGAHTVEELTTRLRALRAWAGWSYHDVHRGVARDRLSRGMPERPVRIANLLGNLPLALAVTAARIRANVDWTLGDHLDRLIRHREALRLDDAVDLSVTLSYRELPDACRRTFRLLALHPGNDVDVYSAAALAGTDLAGAQRQLDQLLDANLLVRPAAGRYGFHDLIRVYATDRVHDDEPASARRAALTRLFSSYEQAASRAMDQFAPSDKQLRPDLPPATTPVHEFADRESATVWLAAERHNLLSVARYAADNGWSSHAVRESDILRAYLDAVALYRDAEILHTLALRTDDPGGRVRAVNNLGNVYLHLGRNEEALEILKAALPDARKLGDHQTERRLLNHVGVALMLLGRCAEAVPYYEDSVRVVRESNEPGGEHRALSSIRGWSETTKRSAITSNRWTSPARRLTPAALRSRSTT